MTKRIFLFIFFISFIGYIMVNESGYSHLGFIFKPLIIPSLLAYFLLAAGSVRNSTGKLLCGALAFSWVGDVLLLFDKYNSLFFIFGLVAFLIAHIFFIVLFYRMMLTFKLNFKIPFFLIAATYYSVLITWLFPFLGALQLPVVIYGAFISVMLLLAMHLPAITVNNCGKIILMGALLFVVSDSMLAINKFYQPFHGADILIMTTYALAQLLIVVGITKFRKAATEAAPV